MNSSESAANVTPEATLETVEVVTGPNPTAAVVWMHGLGADGHDFEPIVPELNWPGAPDAPWLTLQYPLTPRGPQRGPCEHRRDSIQHARTPHG